MKVALRSVAQAGPVRSIGSQGLGPTADPPELSDSVEISGRSEPPPPPAKWGNRLFQGLAIGGVLSGFVYHALTAALSLAGAPTPIGPPEMMGQTALGLVRGVGQLTGSYGLGMAALAGGLGVAIWGVYKGCQWVGARLDRLEHSAP